MTIAMVSEDEVLLDVIRLEGKLQALQRMCGIVSAGVHMQTRIADEKACVQQVKLRHTISTTSTCYVESSGSADTIDTPGEECMEVDSVDDAESSDDSSEAE
jgi:hypothetical protein